MFTSLSTLAGGLIGKVAIGTSVVVASAGGAHATGAVDLPMLPDAAPAEVVAVRYTIDLFPDGPADIADPELVVPGRTVNR